MSRTKNGFLWTDFETNKILELTDTYTHSEIANKLNRTPNAVKKQASKARTFLKSIEDRKKFIDSIK